MQRGHGEMSAAYGGRGPLGPPWPYGGRGHGRGPRHGRPFGPLLLVAVVVAAFTGWWMILPVLACVWFAAAFAGLRHTRRRHLPLR